jgi:hypothetical protein
MSKQTDMRTVTCACRCVAELHTAKQPIRKLRPAWQMTTAPSYKPTHARTHARTGAVDGSEVVTLGHSAWW